MLTVNFRTDFSSDDEVTQLQVEYLENLELYCDQNAHCPPNCFDRLPYDAHLSAQVTGDEIDKCLALLGRSSIRTLLREERLCLFGDDVKFVLSNW